MIVLLSCFIAFAAAPLHPRHFPTQIPAWYSRDALSVVTPSATFTPHSAGLLMEIFRNASHSSQTRIRFVGQAHSSSPIHTTVPGGFVVSLENYTIAASVADGVVSFPAGLTLRDAYTFLKPVGLELAVCSPIADVSVGGALASGRASGCAKQPSIAAGALSAFLMTPTSGSKGAVFEREVREEGARSLTEGVAGALGVTGAILSVRMPVAPLRVYEVAGVGADSHCGDVAQAWRDLEGDGVVSVWWMWDFAGSGACTRFSAKPLPPQPAGAPIPDHEGKVWAWITEQGVKLVVLVGRLLRLAGRVGNNAFSSVWASIGAGTRRNLVAPDAFAPTRVEAECSAEWVLPLDAWGSVRAAAAAAVASDAGTAALSKAAVWAVVRIAAADGSRVPVSPSARQVADTPMLVITITSSCAGNGGAALREIAGVFEAELKTAAGESAEWSVEEAAAVWSAAPSATSPPPQRAAAWAKVATIRSSVDPKDLLLTPPLAAFVRSKKAK